MIDRRYRQHIKGHIQGLSRPGIKYLCILLIWVVSGNVLPAQHGLKAEYYDGQNFERLVATRIESHIDLSWNNTPPVEGIDPHVCSIRWTGRLRPAVSGEYTFAARVDDGIRVWVGDKLVIDDWHLNDVGVFNGKVYMEAGGDYDLKVEYFNALIEGEVRLLWEIPNKKWYGRLLNRDYQVIGAEYFYQPPQVVSNRQAELANYAAVSPSDAPPPARVPVKRRVNSADSKKHPVKVTAPPEELPVIEEKVPPAETKEESLTPEIIDDYIPKNIRFEHAKTDILIESFRELERFADFMNRHPELRVKIEGHTDPVGNAAKNLELSERRAYAVARFLVKHQVAADRIEAEGFGGTRPLVVPEEGEYHPANRRVELIVLKD